MVLATGAVHTHLVRQSLRTFTSLNVRAAQCIDIHTFAVLIGVGATTVNAYLAQECIADRVRRGLFGNLDLKTAVGHYKKAVDKGLLKVMSKLGISVISSYRGGYNFEAIGLSRALVAEFFPGMQSRISGIGLTGIARKVLGQHALAWDADVGSLPVGGNYNYAVRGETHAFEAGNPHLAKCGRVRQLHHLSALCGCGAENAAGCSARPARFPHRGTHSYPHRRGRERRRDPQAAALSGDFARRAEPGGARDAVDRDEPDRRAVGQRRGRRGRGAQQATRQRRQRRLRDQADRVGPVWGDGGVSGQLPRKSKSRLRKVPSPAKAGSFRVRGGRR